jgi:uncharacterized membrane protein
MKQTSNISKYVFKYDVYLPIVGSISITIGNFILMIALFVSRSNLLEFIGVACIFWFPGILCIGLFILQVFHYRYIHEPYDDIKIEKSNL